MNDVHSAPSAPQVRTLLLTDLVDSTSLVERLGDGPAAELFREHDRLVLELQQRWRGRLIDRSDGLLLLFERPLDGLGFALDYARGLRTLGESRKLSLQARAGLHVGEVLTWKNSATAVQAGAKPLEVEGLAKPLAGRLMTLARPGQILLSATAEPLARRAARELGERAAHLIWKSHGRWRFKGVPDPQEVFEVGEPGFAVLRAPKQVHAKAWRDIPLWRRPVALAAELLLVAGMATGVWFATRPAPAIAFEERDWVVVGDLRNLTGDARLEDSLEQAFRISLEQSRYVNLLSDLKVRETLQHMQRKPGTQVDRALGSEIALRDGARALLLPTVAEVGGRLRVSAEVIDPRTQTTVYAVSADGRGAESALASIDQVTEELREKLGEAMEDVQENSVPLPNVATPSLDALKAFAVARNVVATTHDRDQALALYRRALELDPQFALAHSDMARMHASLGEVSLALGEWRKALALPHRLSAQERMWIELMLGQYAAPRVFMRKVSEYRALYPDDSSVAARLGSHQWHDLNDFKLTEATMRQTTMPQYEQRQARRYMVGIALLGQDRIDDAIAEFKRARQGGFSGVGEMHARAFDALGRHDESDRVYRASTAGRDGWQGEAGVVTGIDRARWAMAAAVARAWEQEAAKAADVLGTLRARAAIASVAVLSGQADAAGELRTMRDAAAARAEEADAVYPPASTELRLLAGLLAAYRNDAALVAEATSAVEGSAAVRDYPTVAQLQQVVLAEQERLAGHPQASATRLRTLAREDTALVAVHWALMRAERDAGQAAAAEAQRRWLATHRGRVFAESTTTDVLKFFNAAVSAEAIRNTPQGKPGAG
jgi:putative peptide modification system cyclase